VIVVDTNVLAYLWLPGDMTGFAESALQRDPEWAAPLLWRSELRNVLAGCIRRQQMTLEAALTAMEDAETLLRGKEHLVPTDRVMKFVAQSSCSAYDCEYVALAADLEAPLVTCDQLVLREFPAIAVSLKRFAAGR
jgi:predicted nucleic acid-binding protein